MIKSLLLITIGIPTTLCTFVRCADSPAPSCVFKKAASMRDPRAHHTLTTLGDGSVLAVGGAYQLGDDSTALDTAEVFEPSTGKFEFTKGRMHRARFHHFALKLASGKVMIVGGLGPDGHPVREVEVYDPATQLFEVDGLLPAGLGPGSVAERPGGGLWLLGGNRWNRLSNEVWTYENHTFILELLHLQVARSNFSATRIGNHVVIAGGFNQDESVCYGTNFTMKRVDAYLCPVETYPPKEAVDKKTLPQIHGSYWHVATPVRSAKGEEMVLFSGGFTNGRRAEVLRDDGGSPADVEIDSALTHSSRDAYLTARLGKTKVVILGGTVCEVIGSASGDGGCSPQGLAQQNKNPLRVDTLLYDSELGSGNGKIASGPNLNYPHYLGAATSFGSNSQRILVTGGMSAIRPPGSPYGGYTQSEDTAEVFECTAH